MTPSSPYELPAPTGWALVPNMFSFSSLRALASCPRRWQLLHSDWGGSGFPQRVHPSAVEGQIVHEALDLLSRALGRHGRPEVGSPEFQEAVTECGFWAFFAEEVADRNRRAASHPRPGPGFVVRTPPRELANRAIRLFREQYRPGGFVTSAPRAEEGLPAGTLLDRLRQDGALSEVRLEHPTLPLAGVLDLVTLEGEGKVAIVDFKTGLAKDSHRDQLFLYATLWWRVTGLAPARVEAQYLDDRWETQVTMDDLGGTEERIGREIQDALVGLEERPAPARVTPDCARCPVRARCDDGWPRAETSGPLRGQSVDCEVTVASAPIPTGFTAHRRDGRELAVVYSFAVGSSLPQVTSGSRLRLVDAVPSDEGKAVELRAWSEVYRL